MVDVQTVTNIVIGLLFAIGIAAQQWDKRQRKKVIDLETENSRLREFKSDSTEFMHNLIAAQRAHNTAQHPDGAGAIHLLPMPERIRNVIDPSRELDT